MQRLGEKDGLVFSEGVFRESESFFSTEAWGRLIE